MTGRSATIVIVAGAVLTMPSAGARASDCEQTSVGFTPISDLGPGLYLGQFQGGLYPGGTNVPPEAHVAEGLARAAAMAALDANGNPDPAGRYVLLSIGMSNTTQEFCSNGGTLNCNGWTFMGQAAGHRAVDEEHLVIANGAKGGQAAAAWASPGNPIYDQVRHQILTPLGVTEAQVRAVWIKQANPGPSVGLPAPNADAYVLLGLLGDIVRAVRVRYPNVEMAFLSSRIYAGYASTGLNPEPYAYETGFSVKWLIDAQIDQMSGGGVDPVAGDLDLEGSAPWLAWGPYLWADGLVPRSDGLIYECTDMQSDGTHPATAAEEKVGTMLLEFFLGSPFTEPWFAGEPACPGDVTGDGAVDVEDIIAVILAWGPCDAACPPTCAADVDGNCEVDVEDLIAVVLGVGRCE